MFTLHSTSFASGAIIPKEFTCEDADRAPDLLWNGPPSGTKSFVLICDDPDAPGGTWTHWVAFDIPASTNSITSNSKPMMKEGVESSGELGYHGPCPPKGHGPHRYFFRLYAIDKETLGLASRASRKAVDEAMRHHSLGTAEYMGRYERK